MEGLWKMSCNKINFSDLLSLLSWSNSNFTAHYVIHSFVIFFFSLNHNGWEWPQSNYFYIWIYSILVSAASCGSFYQKKRHVHYFNTLAVYFVAAAQIFTKEWEIGKNKNQKHMHSHSTRRDRRKRENLLVYKHPHKHPRGRTVWRN